MSGKRLQRDHNKLLSGALRVYDEGNAALNGPVLVGLKDPVKGPIVLGTPQR